MPFSWGQLFPSQGREVEPDHTSPFSPSTMRLKSAEAPLSYSRRGFGRGTLELVTSSCWNTGLAWMRLLSTSAVQPAGCKRNLPSNEAWETGKLTSRSLSPLSCQETQNRRPIQGLAGFPTICIPEQYKMEATTQWERAELASRRREPGPTATKMGGKAQNRGIFVQYHPRRRSSWCSGQILPKAARR